jgi:transposase-like protein
MRKAVKSRRWSMTLPPKMKRTVLSGRRQMEKTERLGIEDKKRRKVPWHTAEEKCRAVLLIWTERSKPGTVCRELGITWRVLNQWQDLAMEGMLLGLESGGLEKGVALSPHLALLLERKSKGAAMKGLEQRLARLQSKSRLSEESPAKPRELWEVGADKKV